MKKVFSKEKWLKKFGIELYEEQKNSFLMETMEHWIDTCNGKTVEECKKLDFIIVDDWLIEVEDER